MRFTKAILYILQNAKEGQTENYKRSDIVKLLFSKTNGKISISDFCLVHGFFDIHKIINAFYQYLQEKSVLQLIQHERPIIPKYQYKKVPIKELKSFLFPISNIKQVLTFKYLAEKHLSQTNLLTYRAIIDDVGLLKVNPIIIKTHQDLNYLKEALKKVKMIGIDIEHYSSTDESFICLIQISAFDEVFVIDRFNCIHEQTKEVLSNLFKSQEVIKIFHSYDNDLKWLIQDYEIEEFHNILDTSRVYGLLQAQKNQTPSLKFLAEKYLKLEMKKQYQKSDWRIRPLFSEMLEYAGYDAKVLPFILLKMIEANPEKWSNSSNIKTYEEKRIIKSIEYKNDVYVQ